MSYGLHEQLELHEIASFKTICMTKSKTMQGLVSDETLRQLLADDVLISTRQLQELSSLLTKANS
ncbi:hypothetical protein [Brevibacillus brevis]|uniref:hypothetical protein n=1 Tax=Brevibacillus brevis TaxID=1393 RepID=UPI000D0FAF8F|nr:hypothetical protein [Brevibacillus brevis]PSJ71321.1 hypothetical protein C7J99_00470 [Brevibacillus brevis]RED28931.1 hypothetical protein DES34_107282 [Brevibacillus brevis]GEC90260.1 hypothetical protein BBR01nite_25910 [Brevibacillus brevis]VEF91474.1 Uncharacterised protein [Brevibacillus brevis]